MKHIGHKADKETADAYYTGMIRPIQNNTVDL